MAEYDLTDKTLPYLDRHLAIPILAYLTEKTVFNVDQVRAAQYELAKGTNMVDYTIGLFKELHPDEEVPAELLSKQEKMLSTYERLNLEAQAVLDVIENPEVAQSLRQDKLQNLQYLKENYNLSLEQITALYHFGQFQYSFGNYSGASDYLYHFRVLSTDNDLNLSAHWGKFASDILAGKWDVAVDELNALKELIDSRSSTTADTAALSQLHSRTWLLHWSLFVYFNHDQGRMFLLETFLNPSYLNTIQTSSPWLLRYLVAAAVLSRKTTSGGTTMTSSRVKHALKDIIKIIEVSSYQYHDPITDFLKELFLEFDFEAAQRELATAVQVVENDFFLREFASEFLDNARYLISEAYCRIHHKIDIADLSERLNLSRDEGEKWIVNLIRETKMGSDAKIDLEKNIIEINRPPLPVYQHVIEKTRGLSFRTQAIGAALEKQTAAQVPESQPGVVEPAR
ncbi:eukaryotic translation initiation factor 3 subunit 6 [Schizopora paradoxa]|uniref:Eukaryotic translation initiation factor 3 subunit E n=1 Tax=Schizopora paradoxa TaxID=27342 RepID=A0A0H2S1Q8_9AGAM|nr:eukaryotic translation initiation factor 3 subunit 6 [Schizopora paradoxa]